MPSVNNESLTVIKHTLPFLSPFEALLCYGLLPESLGSQNQLELLHRLIKEATEEQCRSDGDNGNQLIDDTFKQLKELYYECPSMRGFIEGLDIDHSGLRNNLDQFKNSSQCTFLKIKWDNSNEEELPQYEEIISSFSPSQLTTWITNSVQLHSFTYLRTYQILCRKRDIDLCAFIFNRMQLPDPKKFIAIIGEHPDLTKGEWTINSFNKKFIVYNMEHHLEKNLACLSLAKHIVSEESLKYFRTLYVKRLVAKHNLQENWTEENYNKLRDLCEEASFQGVIEQLLLPAPSQDIERYLQPVRDNKVEIGDHLIYICLLHPEVSIDLLNPDQLIEFFNYVDPGRFLELKKYGRQHTMKSRIDNMIDKLDAWGIYFHNNEKSYEWNNFLDRFIQEANSGPYHSYGSSGRLKALRHS